MRVLFLTYPRFGLGKGGFQVQVNRTIEELTTLGIDVVRFDPWSNQLPGVDLVHVFSLEGTLVYHVRHASLHGVPVVTSPVFNVFSQSRLSTTLKVRTLSRIPGMFVDYRHAREVLNASTAVIALNEQERGTLRSAFALPDEKLHIVPNGIDERFFDASPALFHEKHSFRGFVLQVGSIEPRKNQLTTIRAVRDEPFELVLIGGVQPGHQGYYEECRRAAGPNVHFLGHINYDDPLLPSAFAAAAAFVLPSFSEVQPLTLYEASAAGCTLVVSSRVPISNELRDRVTTVPPSRVSSLRSALRRAVREGETARRAPTGLLTWREVARRLIRRYEQCLSTRPSARMPRFHDVRTRQ